MPSLSDNQTAESALRNGPRPAGTTIAIAPAAELPARNLAVQGWENEGGHLTETTSAARIPSDVSQLIPEGPVGAERLAAMRTRFEADFADGLVGQHHNTFQHRSRVLRQLDDEPGVRGAGAPSE